MASPKVAPEQERARCVYVTLALGKALLNLPDGLKGSRKDADAMKRTIRWHSAISEECSMNKLPRNNGLGVVKKMERFNELARIPKKESEEGANFRAVALLWACVGLVWDVRVTCPTFGRTRAWRFLNLAVDQLGRAFLRHYEGADLAGDALYLELAW